MPRVLLADDIVRAVTMVEALSESDPDIQVCGVAISPQELFVEVRSLQPDVVIVREKFAGVDVFALAQEVPDMAPDTRVVVLAEEDTPDGRTRAQRAGVAEYVTGEPDGDTVAAAVHAAVRAPASVMADRAGPAPVGADPDAPSSWGIRDADTPSSWGVRDAAATAPVEAPAWVFADPGAAESHDAPAPAETPASWIQAPAPDEDGKGEATTTGPTTESTVEGDDPAEDGWARAPDVMSPIVESEAPAPPAPPSLAAMVELESDPDPIQPVVRRTPQRRGERKQAEIFIVFAGKGGVGKSTVATNLSCALATDGAAVAIVDLDLQFGDVGVMLGVEHHRTIEEIVQVGESIDMDYLEEVLGTGPAGVRVLLAPSSPELADLVTTAVLRATIRELAKNFDYVIIDAAAHLEERTLEMIEIADHIVVVTAFNVTSVKDTKIMLKLLASLGIEKDKIAVILNQTRQKTNFSREEVEESLRFRVVTQLPFEPRIVDEAIDHGKPFVINEPKAEITRQFRTLVDYLAPTSSDDHPGADVPKTKDGGKPKANRRRFSLGRS